MEGEGGKGAMILNFEALHRNLILHRKLPSAPQLSISSFASVAQNCSSIIHNTSSNFAHEMDDYKKLHPPLKKVSSKINYFLAGVLQ